MRNFLIFSFVLILPLIFISCSGNSKELREKAVSDSIARVQTVADSIKIIEAQFPKSLVIHGTNVNMRVDAKLDAVRIKQLKTGDTCEVLEKGRKQTIDDKEDYWYKIKFKNKEGWVFGAFTSIKQLPVPEVKQNNTGIMSQKKNNE